MGWNQHHCEDYQILIPTNVHGLKLELEQSRYHKNRNDALIDALQTSEGHNFLSDHLIFEFHTILETENQDLSKRVKISLIKGGWGQQPLKGRYGPTMAATSIFALEAINRPRHAPDGEDRHFSWNFPYIQPLSTFFLFS